MKNRKMSSRLHDGIQKILSVFFPAHCLACEKIISKDGLFCSDCWPKLQFITSPKCPVCSYPFDVEIKHMSPLCARCLLKKPSFDATITVFRYNHIVKKIIGAFKYRDQTFLAKKMARILYEKAKNEIDDADLIVAVPLHEKRLRKRKFNQAVLLIRELKKLSPKIRFYPDVLFRTIHTKSQIELRKKEREKNLKRAFLVNKKYLDEIKDKKILLVDDVMTTGATLENCAKILKKRGAKKITVLTIAKTVFYSSL